jgi:hypothetical protein
MPQSCTYDGKTYDHGSVVCQSGWEYRCNDGQWDALNTRCQAAHDTGAEADLQDNGAEQVSR